MQRRVESNLTYEEACKLLGYAALPLLEKRSRERVTKLTTRITKNGEKPVAPILANVYRDQIAEFY
jgi:hypothetical protein